MKFPKYMTNMNTMFSPFFSHSFILFAVLLVLFSLQHMCVYVRRNVHVNYIKWLLLFYCKSYIMQIWYTLIHFFLIPGLSSLRGGFFSLRPAGELRLWGGGRRHGVTGHTACWRCEDPHSNQPIPLEHNRCNSLHLCGQCSLNPWLHFLF